MSWLHFVEVSVGILSKLSPVVEQKMWRETLAVSCSFLLTQAHFGTLLQTFLRHQLANVQQTFCEDVNKSLACGISIGGISLCALFICRTPLWFSHLNLILLCAKPHIQAFTFRTLLPQRILNSHVSELSTKMQNTAEDAIELHLQVHNEAHPR